jgi:hypothetical protein
VQLIGQILAIVQKLGRHDADRITVDGPRQRDTVAIDDVGARGNESRRRRPIARTGIE